MRIGILGACPEEIALLHRDLAGARREEVGGRAYCQGSYFGHDAVIAFSRWGKVAAASTATTLIDRFAVDAVLFAGVAGALDPGLNVGDVVVATSLLQHDMDAGALPGLARFEIPLLGVSDFPCDAALAERLARAAEDHLAACLADKAAPAALAEFGIARPRVHSGQIISGDQFIAGAAQVAELRRALPRALCTEMEGAAVAQVCFEHGVPVAVVRVISDKADDNAAVDFPRFITRVAGAMLAGITGRFVAALP